MTGWAMAYDDQHMGKTRRFVHWAGRWAAVWALAWGTVGTAHAMDITLRMPTLASGNHRYFHKLLTEALRQAGHHLTIVPVDNLPQTRMALYLENGELDLNWFVQTKERDTKFVPIEFGLTRGLIGQRVLLIPKGAESEYAAVNTLEDFIALNKTAGLGKGWADLQIWKENGLKFMEQDGDWKLLYGMLASRSRGVDYFPRGANEITAEAANRPELAIEPRLLLVYHRDIHFYLSRSQAQLQPVLEAALRKADKSGLHQQLINEFFGPALVGLNLRKRVKINLKVPAE